MDWGYDLMLECLFSICKILDFFKKYKEVLFIVVLVYFMNFYLQ